MPLRCPAPDYNLSLRSASPSFRRASIHYPRLFFAWAVSYTGRVPGHGRGPDSNRLGMR